MNPTDRPDADLEARAEALYRRLRGEAAGQPGDPQSVLADQLQTFARRQQPASDFQAQLGARLSEAADAAAGESAAAEEPQAPARWPFGRRSFGRRRPATGFDAGPQGNPPAEPPRRAVSLLQALSLSGLAVALIVTLAWGIGNLLPQMPAISFGSQAATLENAAHGRAETSGGAPYPYPSPSPTTPYPAPQRTPGRAYPAPGYPPPGSNLLPTGLPSYRTARFGGVTLGLQTSLPDFPPGQNGTAQVFAQAAPLDFTAEMALEAARRLGVEGQVYRQESEAPQMAVFTVTDGYEQVVFLGSPGRFYYQAAVDRAARQVSEAYYSFEEMAAAAAGWLKGHGFDRQSYQFVAGANYGEVFAVPLADGLPVIFNGLDGPWMRFTFDPPNGLRLQSVDAAPLNIEPAASLPIRSAAEAWQRLLAEDSLKGVSYAVRESTAMGSLRTWRRVYPAEQPVEIFGYASVLQPALPGGAPLAMLWDYPLAGGRSAGFAAGLQLGTFYQVWGVIHADAAGRPSLEVSGWQESPFEDLNLEGTLERDDDAFLLTADGRRLLLPGLPAEIIDGQALQVRGVVLESDPPTLEWSWINAGVSAYNGASQIEDGFATINLLGGSQPFAPQLTATPMTNPYAGQPVDGLEGQFHLARVHDQDGSFRLVGRFNFFPQEGAPDMLAEMDYPDLASLEELQNLPVRIYGRWSDDPFQPRLIVERYEEVYPGVRIQAWIGTGVLGAADGRPAVLFTAQDGVTYVLKGYVDAFAGSWDFPEGQVIIEGYQIPGLAIGGYPLIEDLSGSTAGERTSLDGYELWSTIIEDILPAGQPFPNPLIINRVDLVYVTSDMKFAAPGIDIPIEQRLLQPAWRFSGVDTSGRVFEILVQAVMDEYLTP